LKSIPDEVAAAGGAAAAGGGIHEGTKGFAATRGTNEPALGLRLNPESFAVGGVVLSFWSLMVYPDAKGIRGWD
jgi:hypothetical protein